ncbi:polyprenyl synthetase family protein [Dysgonomonas termitidis]|uniref:Polyprenyl synthetase family protein n=1 Tax=Dysgonomonas termitidis TaxID=1516126 RepID=A0ABV9L2S8_9BACT
MLIKKLIDKSKLFEDSLIHFLDERLSSYTEVRRQSLYPINDIGILFRPYLFCTGINMSNKKIESNYYDIAVAIELLQISTLIIDDIFDDSPIRNGQESMPKKFGIKNTVIIGELFRSLSNEIILKNQYINDSEKRKIIANLEEAYQKICIGQFWDLQYEKLPIITEEKYFEMIAYTTGYFIQKSFLSGAVIAGINEQKYHALSEYGLKLGTAYQLRDDLVNILTDGSNGKIIAEDLVAHKKRLPIIYVLNSPKYKTEFCRIWNKSSFSSNDIDILLDIIEKSKSVEYCISQLERLCKEAIDSIKPFKFGGQKKELIDLANLVCSI